MQRPSPFAGFRSLNGALADKIGARLRRRGTEVTNKVIERTGGRSLVEALAMNGVNTIFGLPDESYLKAFDAITSAAGKGNCRQPLSATRSQAERDGKLEKIRATDGAGTGMKWLAEMRSQSA